jgi:uncharacterized phage protein gp47/JayE
MTAPIIAGQYAPTKEDLVNIYKRAIAAGAARRGLTVNVLPGSEYDDRAKACAAVVLPAFANGKLALQALNPLTATGDYLIELASVFGVRLRDAAPSTGFARISVVGPAGTVVTIPSGYVCTGDDGNKYETTETNTDVADNALVEITSQLGGASTEKAANAKLTWDDNSIAKLKRTVTVATGGITGGRDGDTEEVLRSRLLERLSSPGTGGNWAYVKTLAENSSAAISAAYVYPAIQGPGSYGVALVSTEPDREVSTSVINGAASAIVADLPGHAKLNITTVAAQYVDIVIQLRLPLPLHGGGKGGGWRDPAPWPNTTSGSVKITSFTSGTGTITTNATALNGLTAGMHLAIFDEDQADDDEETLMFEFVVATAVVDGGFVKITAVGGFPKSYAGAYISAGAEKINSYAQRFLEVMRAMGPGEKTSNTNILPRGSRKPTVDVSGPSDLTSAILRSFESEFPEIQNCEWHHRYSTGTTTTKTAPSVPAAITDPPYILAVRELAFIRGAA